MNDRLIVLLEEIHEELGEAVEALREEKLDVAVAKMQVVAVRLRSASQEVELAA